LLASVFVKIAQHDADLARQARRAASSIALNCGEAAGVRGGNRRLRLLTALGSAREVEAACDVAEALGYAKVDAETRAVLNHVIGALAPRSAASRWARSRRPSCPPDRVLASLAHCTLGRCTHAPLS